MSVESYKITYNVKTYPIVFVLNPAALESSVIAQYPGLVTGEVKYTPEYKALTLTQISDVRLNPSIEIYRTGGKYMEYFLIPVIANPTKMDNARQVHSIRQRNFEEQVLHSPLDRNQFRSNFKNIAIHLVTPVDTVLGLEPFMSIYNGVSTDPLVIRNMISSSFQKTIMQINGTVMRYLFTE